MTIEFTDSNFKEKVLESDKPVLVDFWAPWCGPCLTLAPTLDEIQKEYEGKAVVGKVNVDENPDLSTEYNIRSIPTLLIFKDGKMIDRHIGASMKSIITEKLDANLA